MANVEELNCAPAKFRLAQREVVNGELLIVTFGPAISPPTKSATSNTAANRLPPIIEKKLGFVMRHFPFLHDNSRCMNRFLSPRGGCVGHGLGRSNQGAHSKLKSSQPIDFICNGLEAAQVTAGLGSLKKFLAPMG